MWKDWITGSPTEVIMVIASTLVFYTAVIVATRLRGLRSFAKMSAYDFVMTIAVGSLFATTIVTQKPSLLLALTALTTVYLMQFGASWARQRWPALRRLTSNQPLLLMKDGQFLEENMCAAHMTREEVYAKLRQANVLHREQVRAVVLETTGDVHVLHGDQLQAELLTGVAPGQVEGRSALFGDVAQEVGDVREPLV